MHKQILYTIVLNILITLTHQAGYTVLGCNVKQNPNPSSPYIGDYIKLGEYNKECLKACDTYQEHFPFDMKLQNALPEVFNYNYNTASGLTLEINLVNFEFSKLVKLVFK